MIVRTLLADHSELALIGLQAVLADSARIEVVGVARDVIAMEALIVRHRSHNKEEHQQDEQDIIQRVGENLAGFSFMFFSEFHSYSLVGRFL